jgi:DNA-binding transcriptional LysR family regulator
MRQLETELRARLLARTTRRVELTQAGRVFLAEAREILARADRAAEIARRTSGGELGTLRIGCGYWMDAARIASSLRAFQRAHPAIHFNLQTSSVPLQLAALREERLDVGFVRPPVAEPSLAFGILGIEPFVVALPLKHRLWARDRIAFSDLAGEPFVLLARAIVPVFHDLVVGLCREPGFAPNFTHEIDQPQAALALVAVGAGISLVPASVRDTRPRGIVFRPLHPSRLVQTALAWRRDVASPLVNAFVQAVPRLWRRE